MEHLADKFDTGRFVGVLLLKVHDQTKGPIFKGCICRPNDDRVPRDGLLGIPKRVCRMGDAYQVMTLSAMGEAETPAGGSVCMRCVPIISLLDLHRCRGQHKSHE